MPQNITFNSLLSPQGLRASGFLQAGMTWFVNRAIGSDSKFSGVSRATGFATIGKAVAAASPGDVILVAPGSYDETVTIPRALAGLSIMGQGPLGSVGISPSANNSGAMVNDADDLALFNIDLNATGTGTALTNTGDRLRALECKFENDDGTGLCALMTLQTVAQRAAKTKGNGADCLFDQCEFAWAASGIKVVGTDQGSVTELRVQKSRFHNLDTAHILEGVGSGGSAASTYASLQVIGNTFAEDEAGTAPTHFMLLNASNSNTGIAAGNFFPVANNSGLNLVSTKLMWSGNFMTGGISTGQPS